MDEEDVRQAAREIRPYLKDLLGTEEAAVDMDLRLTNLLTDAQAGRQVKVPLLAILGKVDATRDWAREFLRNKIAPQLYRTWRQSPDALAEATAKRWTCPHGDFEWYAVGDQRPPLCPTHQVELVSA